MSSLLHRVPGALQLKVFVKRLVKKLNGDKILIILYKKYIKLLENKRELKTLLERTWGNIL